MIRLSVSEFAVPVPRVGSIETHSGYGRSAEASEKGIEIHQQIQERRKEEDPEYQAEVLVSQVFERRGRSFEVTGRMDGFLDQGASARIEEIKSALNLEELARKLNDEHPYVLQLKTYGYFHFLKTGEVPELRFVLVSLRNGETREQEVELDLDVYRAWLDRRLQELELEVAQTERRRERRKKVAQSLKFPFLKPRTGQVELIETIERGFVADRRLLLQAPTGLGKTVGVLYPTLRDSLSRGQRVIYVTPKNSQHAVAEDAVERFQAEGAALRSLTVTAKSKICMKAEPLCHPDYCEYAKDHYSKVSEAGLKELLAKKKKFTAKTFSRLAEEHQVCPFELQFEAIPFVDVVVCDYNYVIGHRGSQGRVSVNALGEDGSPNLVIDEAHNLPARGMDSYSPSLATAVLDSFREDSKSLPARFRKSFGELLDRCVQVILNLRPAQSEGAVKIQPPVHPFLDQEEEIRGYLSRYLESDLEIRPRDPVLRLSSYWGEFTAALEFVAGAGRPEFFTTYQSTSSAFFRAAGAGAGNPSGVVRITCCDASEFLRPCFDSFHRVVAFSATLKPFEYYSQLSGLESERLLKDEFRSPFDPVRRKLLVIPQVTTKYSERARQAPKIAEAISRIGTLHAGNYFVFFPSFAFLEQVRASFEVPPGFRVVSQAREMKASDVQDLLSELADPESDPTFVFAVQGGVLSEGVDYPGRMIIGAFIVGPPLPVFDLEREEMRRFYQERYGAGFDYAYSFPAMAKAIQAAGRVIRTETDRGLVVLMDSRFLEPAYARSMPSDWFSESPRELVSSAILEEVRQFWKQTGSI